MFIDIYFTEDLPVDRDDIEDALAAIDGFEIVGAGTGDRGSNIDLEVEDSVAEPQALRAVTEVLHRFGAERGTRVKLTGTTGEDR